MLEIGQEWLLYATPFKLKKITAPSAAEVPAGTLAVYAKDKAGVSALYLFDDAGSEREIAPANTVTGTGVVNRLAYWTSASTVDDVPRTFTAGSVLFVHSDFLPQEDNANFFWDDTNNIFALGSPGSIHGSVSNTRMSLERDATNILEINSHVAGGTTFAGIDFYKSLGTHAAPSVLGNNDFVGSIRAKCYDGNSYEDVARILLTTGTTGPADGATPGTIIFQVTPPSSVTLTERFRIGQSGEWGIGGANFGAVGNYFRSGGSAAAPVWSTLVLPNTATVNRIPFASATDTWSDSADLTYDGTDLAIASGKRFRMQSQNRIRYLNSMARAYASGDQTAIAVNAFTSVTLNTDSFDTDALHDTVTNTSRITFALTGKYLVGGTLYLDVSGVTAITKVALRVIVDGATTSGIFGYQDFPITPTDPTDPGMSTSALISVAATSYAELQVIALGASGTFAVKGSSNANFISFWAVYLGE